MVHNMPTLGSLGALCAGVAKCGHVDGLVVCKNFIYSFGIARWTGQCAYSSPVSIFGLTLVTSAGRKQRAMRRVLLRLHCTLQLEIVWEITKFCFVTKKLCSPFTWFISDFREPVIPFLSKYAIVHLPSSLLLASGTASCTSGICWKAFIQGQAELCCSSVFVVRQLTTPIKRRNLSVLFCHNRVTFLGRCPNPYARSSKSC